jgi:hypothetical protein
VAHIVPRHHEDHLFRDVDRGSQAAGGCRQAMFTLVCFVNMTRHKHLKLDQSKIDRAKKLLRTKTESETIERALDLVLGEEPILKAHRKAKGVGGFESIFK